jgi:predicted dehydrogenase
MKIAVVGMGYWGPNLVRNFLSTNGVTNVICCDTNPDVLESVAKKFPGIGICKNYDELLTDSSVKAVAVATPVSTHFELGRKALKAGKHLLMEKPFTATSAQAEELIALAEKQSLVLMVDHTFIYTGAVRKIKELMDSGKIGSLLYFDSVRVNLGLFQHDTNVIWDLAPHDISIIDHLVNTQPISVQATGARHYYNYEDIAYLTVQYPDNLLAHFHVNWISPVKVRKILIGGSQNMIVYDDMEPSEKVKLYDKGVELKSKEDIYRTLVSYRTGDMLAPKLDGREALSLMCEEFIECITTDRQPLTGASSALNVVRVLEAADKSLNSGGEVIELLS